MMRDCCWFMCVYVGIGVCIYIYGFVSEREKSAAGNQDSA